MAVDNDPSFSMGNVLKAGLAVLAAEGLYLWAFDKDDKDDSQHSRFNSTCCSYSYAC